MGLIAYSGWNINRFFLFYLAEFLPCTHETSQSRRRHRSRCRGRYVPMINALYYAHVPHVNMVWLRLQFRPSPRPIVPIFMCATYPGHIYVMCVRIFVFEYTCTHMANVSRPFLDVMNIFDDAPPPERAEFQHHLHQQPCFVGGCLRICTLQFVFRFRCEHWRLFGVSWWYALALRDTSPHVRRASADGKGCLCERQPVSN